MGDMLPDGGDAAYRPRPAPGFRPERIVLAKGSQTTPSRRLFAQRLCRAYPDAEDANLPKVPHNRVNVGEVDPVRACRTQIVTEVRDAAKMATNWSRAIETEDAMTLLHRVVFYGDHMDSVRHLARLMHLNVVEEG